LRACSCGSDELFCNDEEEEEDFEEEEETEK